MSGAGDTSRNRRCILSIDLGSSSLKIAAYEMGDDGERPEIRWAHDVAGHTLGADDRRELLRHVLVHTINPLSEAVAAV